MVYSALNQFLEGRKKKENEQHTHSQPGKGSYKIDNHELGDFYELLKDSIFEKNDKITIFEKVQSISPLVIDLDFKYKDKINKRQYNTDVLNKIIIDIFTNINEFYHLSDDQKVCWVMEKREPCPAPQKSYESKDGIHFLFPYIVAEKSTYLKLREIMLETDYKSMIEEEGLIPPSNTMEEIIDDNIYKNGNWFIYGSGKPNEDMRCELTSILKLSNEHLINLDTELYLENPLEIIKKNSVSNRVEINVEYTDELNKRLKTNMLRNSSSMESVDSIEITPAVLSAIQKHDIELSKKLALLLSVERASNYGSWLEVGYCLHGISKNLLHTWTAFSKKWDSWIDSSECERQWEWFNRNNNRSITIASLHYWAKKDDPENYEKHKKEALIEVVTASIKGDKKTGAHSDVANVIYHWFKDCFVCANIKDNIWYYWNEKNGGRWEETEMGHILRSRLSHEIVELYQTYQCKWQRELNQLGEDDEWYSIFNNRVANCCKVIIQLKDSGYKDKIMKESKEYFYDATFMDKLNANKSLLGFENGVYDLNESTFREGLPSDYVSLSTGLTLPVHSSYMPAKISDIGRYANEITDYDEILFGLNDFLEKVFPNSKVREYTMRFLSSCLSGEIREEKFYFWTGSGGNGKSKLIDLIEFALGDYSQSLGVEYLTTKKGSSSSASPEVESIKHARFVWMSEPEKNDVIYAGKLKLMTGGDKMTSRGLYKGVTNFDPQFKIILMCNDLPKLAGNDGGLWRRIEVVEYISKFTDNPRPSPANPYQYKADEQLKKKLETWKAVFIIELLKKYVVYNKEGTKAPKEVKEKTKAYRASNDIIANWIDEDLIECESFSPFEELYDSFKRWSDDEGYPIKQQLPQKEVKEALLKYQEDKTQYGLVLGESIKDGCPNGTKRKPKFNLKTKDD